MEELQGIAMAYYEAADKKTKKVAKDFFKAMDDDGDKKINLQEFLNFMKTECYNKQMSNPNFFTLLNRDGSGTLDFDQVKTLFYIIKSGRPVCEMLYSQCDGRGCGIFVTGLYFTCVKCFHNGSEAFNVCSTCFKDRKKYKHHQHNSNHDFLDNFVLLESKKMKASNSAPISNTAEAGSSSTSLAVTLDAAKMIAFQALGIAIGIGEIVYNVTANCSIM